MGNFGVDNFGADLAGADDDQQLRHTVLTATVTVGGISTNWTTTTRAGSLKIFQTSSGYLGSALGGLAGADALCQSAAGTAGYAGTYKAILSDATTNAKDRLTLTYPIVRASDGTTVASVNLWIGSIDNKVDLTAARAWTGSDSAGVKVANTCSSWTAAGSGGQGWSTYTTGGWITDGTGTCGSTANRLYCIQQ